MTDSTKQEISIALDLLKGTLIRNGVSMATDKNGNLMFLILALMLRVAAKNLMGLGLILMI